jgi:hypothetical protein
MQSIKAIIQTDRKKAALLVLLCLFLGFYLLRIYRTTLGGSTNASVGPSPPPESGRAKGMPEDLASYNPHVDLEILEKLQTRPAPAYDRSPFDFGLTPEEKKAADDKNKIAAAPPPPPVPVTSPLLAPVPPPPPALTLKALGYEEAKGGPRQAFIADCPNGENCSENDRDVHVYSARKGDSFGNRYKVLQITATSVEVEDEAYHRTAQLQFPQEPSRQRQ